MNKVAAVVVTYNRLHLLQDCISALRKQTYPLDKIIVVNNGSTDGTREYLLLQQDLIIINQENIGGAGGFYSGIKKGYDLGFEWIWIMDDDCRAMNNCLEQMFYTLNNTPSLAVTPIVENREGAVDLGHRGFFNFSQKFETTHNPIETVEKLDFIIDFSSFVGLMVNRKIISKVGLPRKEFFIHNDDVEFCLRIKKVAPIVLSVDSKIVHLENATIITTSKKFFKHRSNRIPIDKLWLRYYGIRNLVWLKKRYFGGFSIYKKAYFFLLMVCSISKQTKEILLYDNHKLIRIYFYLSAYRDGWNGKFDNERPKRILSKHF